MLMMIKRSNRGKLSRSLGGRGSTRQRKGVQRKWQHPLPYALILVLGLVLSLGMVPAMAEAEEISGPPAHEKSASKVNEDGTVDVTLNVTGAVDKHSKSSKSDVIVVLDLSGSMNQVSSPNPENTYFTDTNYNWKVAYYKGGYWYDGDGRYYKAGWCYVDSYGNTRPDYPYEGSDFYPTNTNEATRLSTAKSAVESLVNKLLANNVSHPGSVNVSLVTFSDRATVKVGLTDKEATIDNAVKDLKAEGGTNWEDALKTASNNIKTRDDASVSVVFVSDGDPTLRNSEGNGEYSYSTPSGLWGTGHDDPYGDNYKYALDKAQKMVDNKWELYSVAAFGNVKNMSKLVTDVYKEQATGHYFKANDSESLNAAFDNIVKSITTTVSYTGVSIHDSLSDSVEYFLPSSDAKEPTFTYMRNGKPWNDAPAAYLNKDGDVVWSVGDLEQNVTYSVTFKVRLTQEAYDAAAPKGDEEAVTSVKTNSDDEAKDYVQYQIKTDVNGNPTTSDYQKSKYVSPTVTVPISTLHVSKIWNKNGWDNVSLPSKLLPPQLQVKVKQQDNKDNKYYDYKTVTLNADNNWSYDVDVAAGPEGHKYTVEEVAPEGWTKKLPDVAFLQGWTEQKGKQEITNTLKTAKLTITKSVKGNFGDTSKDFSFSLTVKDASGNPITNVTPDKEDTSGGVILTNGSFTLKDGQKLVVELPYGALYNVVENDPKGNDTVDYTTSITTATDTDATTVENARTASSPKDGITENTTITYKNYREVKPDVGVDLGSGAPYAVVFGGAGLAGVIWMVLKRRNSLGI